MITLELICSKVHKSYIQIINSDNIRVDKETCLTVCYKYHTALLSTSIYLQDIPMIFLYVLYVLCSFLFLSSSYFMHMKI